MLRNSCYDDSLYSFTLTAFLCIESLERNLLRKSVLFANLRGIMCLIEKQLQCLDRGVCKAKNSGVTVSWLHRCLR